MQALSERLDALLAGTTLRRADLLGFSSLKTYDPSPDSLKGPGSSRSAGGPSTSCGSSTAGAGSCSTSPRRGASTSRSRRRRPSHAARWRASSFGQGEGGLDGEGIGVLVREHGTQRKASWWVLAPVTTDRWPASDPSPGARSSPRFIRTSDSNRHLTTDLRDQHVVSGIGRGLGRRHLAPGQAVALRLAALAQPRPA